MWPCTYHYKQIIIEHCRRVQYHVVVACDGMEFTSYAIIFLIQHTAYQGLNVVVATEYHTATQLTCKAGYGTYPTAETGLVLSIAGYRHHYARNCIKRYVAAAYDEHSIG